MIFRGTAAVVSYLSMTGVIFWFILRWKGKVNSMNHPVFLFFFLSFYSLHRWLIAGMLMAVFITKWLLKTASNTNISGRKALNRFSADLFVAGPLLLCMDIAREYSVWHEWIFQPLPLLFCLAAILTGTWLIYQQRDSHQ